MRSILDCTSDDKNKVKLHLVAKFLLIPADADDMLVIQIKQYFIPIYTYMFK